MAPIYPGDGIEDSSAEAFRLIWRGFGSTVTLISTIHEGRRHAMAATAVSTVSMEPPSLLICVNRNGSAYAPLRERGAFSLGITSAGTGRLVEAIARAPASQRFAQGTWRSHPETGTHLDGLPWLAEAQATLFCVTDTAVEYGSHTIFIARVMRSVSGGDHDPLIYCNGRYGRFSGGLD